MNTKILYHGSKEIIERPTLKGGKETNDYGYGFYCTKELELAKEWACPDNNDGYANEYLLDLSNLVVLDLTDKKYNILNWIALLLQYRIPANMNINDKRYDNQGLHVVLALFTVDKGRFKVLLIKRKNEPFLGKWILVGGCAYNNETGEQAMKRELKEKTNIDSVDFEMFDVFTNPNRSPLKRMIAIGYIGVSDASIIESFKQTKKASDADWFEIDRVPELGYDHKEILDKAIAELKRKIFTTNIMKNSRKWVSGYIVA